MIPITSPRAGYKRATRVARIDGRIGLDELTRLAGVIGRGVGTVQGADDAAGHRETESERIAKRQHRLSRMQFSGISPGCVREVVAFHFDDGQIGQWVGADHLGRQNSAVAHGDANVGRAIHYVVVGDDVAVGRDDYAAAQAVLHPGLTRLRLLSEHAAERAELLPELLHVIVIGVASGHVGFGAGRDRHIHDGGSHAGGQSFHGLIER